MTLTSIYSVTDQAISERDKYTEYSYIWKESRKTFMFYFLQFSRVLVGEELQRFEEAADLLKKNPPSLDLFREKINFYEDHCRFSQIPSLKNSFNAA